MYMSALPAVPSQSVPFVKMARDEGRRHESDLLGHRPSTSNPQPTLSAGVASVLLSSLRMTFRRPLNRDGFFQTVMQQWPTHAARTTPSFSTSPPSLRGYSISPSLLLPRRVGDDAVVHPVQVVVDGRAGGLRRLGRVHACPQGVLESSAALGVVTGRGPACCSSRQRNCSACVQAGLWMG